MQFKVVSRNAYWKKYQFECKLSGGTEGAWQIRPVLVSIYPSYALLNTKSPHII